PAERALRRAGDQPVRGDSSAGKRVDRSGNAERARLGDRLVQQVDERVVDARVGDPTRREGQTHAPRERMCVASGAGKTSTGSNPNDSTPSKMRSPEPRRTGAMSSESSSTTPATSAWRTVEAPPAMSTPCSPAVSRACAYAASKPSVTK